MNQLHVAIQMDPIESIDIKGDTSFRLALEAQRRNHYVYIYQPKDLSWSKEGVQAITKSVRLKDEIGNHFKIKETKNTLLKYFDVILMRQDPPFDMAYITSTHLLEHLPKTTQVINNPKEVRNAPEKILITNFPDLIPPTLISNNKEQIISTGAGSLGGIDVEILPAGAGGGEAKTRHFITSGGGAVTKKKMIWFEVRGRC